MTILRHEGLSLGTGTSALRLTFCDTLIPADHYVSRCSVTWSEPYNGHCREHEPWCQPW